MNKVPKYLLSVTCEYVNSQHATKSPNGCQEFAVFKWIFKAMATTPAQTQLLLWTIKDLSNHSDYIWKSTSSTLPQPKKPHYHPAKYLGNTPAMCVPIMNSFSWLLRLLCIFYNPILLLTYTALTGKKRRKRKRKNSVGT